MIDDLGLTASLKSGKQTFARAGAFSEIKAAEPTEFLRARIASPAIDITITDDTCLLNTLTLSPDDDLTVQNRTEDIQDFKIRSLDIDVNIPAGKIVEIPLSGAEAGDLVVLCGRNQRINAPIDSLTLTISEATATPVATSQGVTVLFDGLIQLASASRTTFSLTELALEAAGSLGEQTIPGPTALITADHPFWVKRPLRLTSTLAANASFVIPPGTSATIENAGKDATTALIVGLIPTSAGALEPSPTMAATDAPGSRSVTRDDEARTPAADTPAIAVYLPTKSAAAETGFIEASEDHANLDRSLSAIMAGARAISRDATTPSTSMSPWRFLFQSR